MLEPPDDIQDWEEDEDGRGLGRFGECLFPGLCVMPSDHFPAECCTWMEMERLWNEAMRRPFLESVV